MTVAYRGPQERLRASPKDIAAAMAEGIAFLYDAAPAAFLGNRAVVGVRFADGRQMECTAVVVAISQEPDPPAWLARFGVTVDAHERIAVDADGRTANPRIFAGGDNTTGPDLVVTAAAAGRRAAVSILKSHRG